MRTSGLRMAICTAVLVGLLPACAAEPTPSPTPSGLGWRCAFAGTGATLAFEGKRLNFTCPQQRDAGVGLLGDPVPGPQGWEMEMGVYVHGDQGFTLQSSEMVTVLEIELSDGDQRESRGFGDGDQRESRGFGDGDQRESRGFGDGMHCPFVGTGASLAFEGKRLNFSCPRDGDKEVGLIGDVLHTDRGWEMERATFAHTDQGFELLSSEMVPIAALIVVDQSAT